VLKNKKNKRIRRRTGRRVWRRGRPKRRRERRNYLPLSQEQRLTEVTMSSQASLSLIESHRMIRRYNTSILIRIMN